MLLMHSKSITPRLQYTVNFFSQELFDQPIRITTSKTEYAAHEGPKLNYSDDDLFGDDFFLTPSGLLFEQGISEQSVECFEINYHPVFFPAKGDLHFDVFAAAFYLISRYEEYLPHDKDQFGRYAHTNSLAYREGFLNLPLVNIWLQQFRMALQQKFPRIVFKGSAFANVITYDIDIAYSYLHKGWLRNLGGTMRSAVDGEWRLILERWLVLLRLKKDPFDCYEWLDALHLYCRLKPYYFFLVARKRSTYDKNVSTDAKLFKELVEYYSATYNVGIHPSWQSGDNQSLLKEELEWLEVVGGKKIQASRQHYLRFTLPDTYRRLIAAGITKDFSMGYGTVNGFRASVSSCYRWYDLEQEKETTLTIYPFCFMDANAFYQLGFSPQQAYKELMKLYDSVKKVNGMMITIWHNNLLGKDPRTEGWKQMFELFMRETVYWDAYYDGALS